MQYVLGFALALSLLLPLQAAAQSGWAEIPCEQSAISFSPPVKCQRLGSYGIGNTDGRATAGRDNVSGWIGSRYINASLTLGNANTYISAYTTEQAASSIRNFNSETQNGTDWSEVKSEGNTTYRTFKVNRNSCVGFDHAGPYQGGGYKWILRGYLCDRAGVALKLEDAKALLSAVSIASSRGLNAYGAPSVSYTGTATAASPSPASTPRAQSATTGSSDRGEPTSVQQKGPSGAQERCFMMDVTGKRFEIACPRDN